MVSRRTALFGGVAATVVVGSVVLVVAFLVSVGRVHTFDRTIYGVTRNDQGELSVVVSPCLPAGIGSLRIDSLGEEEAALFSAKVDHPDLSVRDFSLQTPPAGYVVEKASPNVEFKQELSVADLTRADGPNLLGVPLDFNPADITAGAIIRGDGAKVSQSEWASCAPS